MPDDVTKGLEDLTRVVETNVAGMRAEVDAMKVASEAEKVDLQRRLDEIETALRSHQVRLPGADGARMRSGEKITAGHFALAAAIEKHEGRAAVARRMPEIEEIHAQTWKRAPSEVHARASTTDVAENAGYLVPEEMTGDLIPILRAQSIASRLPMRIITDPGGWSLTSIRQTTATAAQWVDELGAATETSVAFAKRTWKPRKVVGLAVTSFEAMRYARPSTIEVLNNDIAEQLALAFDLAIFEGSGVGGQPIGLANTTGVLAYDGTTEPRTASNGRDLTDYHMHRIVHTLENGNVPLSGLGFAMHTKLRQILQLQYADAPGGLVTSGVPDAFPHLHIGIRPVAALDTMFGGPVATTTQLASNLTIGGSSDGARVYAGNWPMYWVVQWGGMAFRASEHATVGSVNLFTQDGVAVKATMLADCGPARVGDFVVATGFRTTKTGV